MRSMSKHASSASYSLYGTGHPPQIKQWLCFWGSFCFAELEFSLDLFEVMLVVVALYELGQ